MVFTYDPATSAGLVRLLCVDTDSVHPIFSDAEINAFLSFEANDVGWAAARALDTIASSQALVLKVVKLLDVDVDGAKVADALRAQAQALRDTSGTPLDYAEIVTSPATWRERVLNQWLRAGP